MTKQQKVTELLDNNEILCARVDYLIRRLEQAAEWGDVDGWCEQGDQAEIKELNEIIRHNMANVRDLSEQIALEG